MTKFKDLNFMVHREVVNNFDPVLSKLVHAYMDGSYQCSLESYINGGYGADVKLRMKIARVWDRTKEEVRRDFLRNRVKELYEIAGELGQEIGS